ncbi:hypothetical protein MMC32_000847 [Xylographa parallela]|nr:hypothetical protein [Xylographa parallela]
MQVSLLMRWHFLSFIVFVVTYGNCAQICSPYLGTHIGEQDCRAALHNLFDPLFRQRPAEDVLRGPRIFHLYDLNEWDRMPRGITVGSCSLAIDIQSSHGEDAISTWLTHYAQMFELIQGCVLNGALGQGGTSTPGNGFVFTIVNPNVVNIANTCMASRGPHRIDVAQCVVGEAVRATRGPNIPAPRPNGPPLGLQHNLLGSPGINSMRGGPVGVGPVGAGTVGAGLVGAGPAGPGPAAVVPAAAPMLDNSMDSDTLDSYMLDFVLNLPPAPDTGDGPSDAGSAAPSQFVPGQSAPGQSAPGQPAPDTSDADPPGPGPSIPVPPNAGPSGARPSTAGPVNVGQGRTLPSAPPDAPIIRQHTHVGSSNRLVAGTWVLQDGRWVDGWRRSGWKAHGGWWLVLGRGQATPYPGGVVPPWRGEGAKPILVNQHTARPNQPVAEAWIAQEGTWQPLEGNVLPVGPWVTEGGWVLLKGEVTR